MYTYIYIYICIYVCRYAWIGNVKLKSNMAHTHLYIKHIMHRYIQHILLCIHTMEGCNNIVGATSRIEICNNPRACTHTHTPNTKKMVNYIF